MAGIGRFGNVLPDERPQVGRRRAIEGMARLGGQALGERGHPGLGVPGEEGLVGGAGLPGGSPAAAYEAFLSGHAQAWMPAFAERLAAEARHPFYRAAAAYLGALLADWPSEA